MRRNAKTAVLGCIALVASTVLSGSAVSAAPQRGCVPTWQQVEVNYSNYITPLDFIATHLNPPAEGAVSALSGSDVRFAAGLDRHGSVVVSPGTASDPYLQQWTGRTVDSAPRQLPIPPWFRLATIPRAQSFSSPDEGWVLVSTERGNHGWQNQMVPYHWQDGRWTMVPTAVSPDPLRHGLISNDVVSVSPNDAWLVGNIYPADRGRLFVDGVHIQRWDGTRWSVVDNPLATVPDARLNSVTAVSANDVWAVGSRHNGAGVPVPLVMHWNGTEWRTVDVPTGNTPAVLRGISGTGPDDIWAVGGQTRPGTNLAVPLVMHWNGRDWQVADLPDVGNSLFRAVYAASPTDVWAVGLFTAGTDAYFLHWDGRSWQRVLPPGAASGVEMVDEYQDIHGTGPNDVWAVGVHLSRSQPTGHRPLVAHLSCGRNR